VKELMARARGVPMSTLSKGINKFTTKV
jgi:chromosome segregation ATPase